MRLSPSLAALFVIVCTSFSLGADGNRLTYLDRLDPYYATRDFPKLETPQWVGEDGVDAVVIFAVDDMQKPRDYEKFLRPILNRLEQVDGKAHLSIMTRSLDPKDPLLQQWLTEGVSLETHTIDHPCPLLQGGDFAKAKSTYDRCVDLLSQVSNSHPVAFRMPCCDSKNTPSPRVFAEIFNKTTPEGNFIRIDSSVFDIYTANDPAYSRNLVIDSDGRERFRKYVPFENFANYIEDHPYPYVIGKLCWEFPCVVPSDWESYHIQGNVNPRLLEDWKAALDATVIKHGVMTMVFHPWGWSSAQQHVDLINYAVQRYGKRVKFMNFPEALTRLGKNVLGGQSLRDEKGLDNGVRLLDLNNDGYVDAVIGNATVHQTRIWSPRDRRWDVSDFPTSIVTDSHADAGVRFGIMTPGSLPFAIVHNEKTRGAWRFDGSQWVSDSSLLNGLDCNGPVLTSEQGRDRGVRLNDLDGDGTCELIVSNEKQQGVFRWNASRKRWEKLPFTLPAGASIVDSEGRDAGLRFVDVDGDGFDDVLFSNDDHYSLHLFTSIKEGWSRQVFAGRHGKDDPLPPLVRNGTDNGGWFLNRSLWVQNEDTTKLPDQVDRRPFSQMVSGAFASAHSPDASLHDLQLSPGFQAEMIASEPLLESPIAFAWGPDRKLWVVEMGDYPLGVDGKGKPGGRVRVLEDTNGDGHYVKSTIFLDNLPFPTGIMPWGKGVLITDAPNILYAEDTRGTGHADVVKVLYSGFVEGNQQHRANGLQYGLDNWIWGCNGHSGGVIRSLKTGQIVNISGRDFRIRPDEGLVETTTGMSQYGHTRNDWGDWFGCDNSNPMYQYVIQDYYLRRNPHFAAPSPVVQVSDTPGTAPVYPISPDLPRFNEPWALHHFTSANSVIVYRDDLFGPLFEGNSFVSEPVGNLVHREVLRREGVVYHSSRAPDEQKSEFLASFDGWFRPTMLRVGPDGALWVCDMYRMVIEHPEWIPKDWQEKLDLRAGHERGRIYRIYPVGSHPRQIPKLDELDTRGLVAALDSPSGWQRDMAQQMLVQKHNLAAAPLLEQAVRNSHRDVCRLQALCTLDGLGSLSTEVLKIALSDAQAGVRRNAVRLCETQFAKHPDLGERVAALASDPDPQVRLQVALSLGEWADRHAGQALAAILAGTEDQYIRAAAMTSLTKENLDPLLTAFMAKIAGKAPPADVLPNLLRFANAVGDDRAVGIVLARTTASDTGKFARWQFQTAAALLDSLAAPTNHGSSDQTMTSAIASLNKLLDQARATATNPQAGTEDRIAAIRLLGTTNARDADLKVLSGLLVAQTPTNIQSAAVQALGRMHDSDAVQVLLNGWNSYGPSLRTAVLDAILNRPEWAHLLVQSIRDKHLLPSDFDAIRRQRLLNSRDRAVREQATRLFADNLKPDRQKVIDAYQPALKLTGDPARGAKVFSTICIACHHFGGVGNPVGPDLASIGDKSPETLLISILDPNRHIEPRYMAYVVQTRDGQTLSGVLGAETAASITLLQANVPPVQLLRTDIVSIRSTGMTLMPEGLESGLSHQDIADLIAHIRAGGKPASRKTFAGNNPQLIHSAPDGSLTLTGTTAEIYGSSLTFEDHYQNLGYWQGEDDHAVWQIELPKPGRFDVMLEYACPSEGAGNGYVAQLGPARVMGHIKSTGSWDHYRRIQIGQLELPAGRHQVSFRSDGPLSGYLCDLRELVLVPVPGE